MKLPVVYDASSDKSQMIALATSSAVPPRFMGIERFQTPAIDPIGLAAARVYLGIDESAADGVHANTFFRNLTRQADRERTDRARMRRSPHIRSQRTQARSVRRDVDDGATVRCAWWTSVARPRERTGKGLQPHCRESTRWRPRASIASTASDVSRMPALFTRPGEPAKRRVGPPSNSRVHDVGLHRRRRVVASGSACPPSACMAFTTPSAAT